ncbi:hypothetical protein WR25_16759 [Diploscapter pachys]|uniref:Calponin-homology (CH) domain-containing protein n=1 Tax=Diploscapter pachys TaxID=2018661 RepID=A0A2A2L826_9BILA|nr:hypothetical protein WR25_16759 [Diploscapter pachys]
MATHGSGGKEQEDEVIPAIRHDDAEWKLIQKNTFTRWVNNHLSKVGESINALDTDFADGLKLIALAAVLSQKNLGKYNKKVSFRSQKLENVSLALNFFQNVEHIKIVNIDSSHIVDHNRKLIMGLIWTLILHYSISMGWTQHNEDGTQSDDTPKTKLLNWIRSRLPGVPITNFTTDWNDGLAIGALVNAISPDSVPDWQSWTPDKALENTQKAMDEAQDKLGIAPLITPAELIHPDIDERSVMTYLSQFPAAKSAPAKPTKAHAYMSRVDEKPLRGQPTEFEVHLTTDGYKPKMAIRDSEGNDVHHTVIKKSSTMFIVKYSPMRVGEHKLQLALTDLGTGATEAVEGGEKIVRVQPAARLRDLPHKVFVKDLVKLEVEDAGDEALEIVVVDSARTNHTLPVLASSDGSLHTAEYIPEHAGLHTVNVFQRKAHIPGSPIRMPVSKKGGYVLYGRGLESEGVRVGDRVEVIVEPESVDSLSVNEGQIALAVRKPDGSFLPVDAVFDSDKDRLTFEYEPTEVGEYIIEATSNGEPIGASPYKVSVSPATPSKVRAFGAGLKSGIVNHPSVFSVETNGQADGLAVSIEGPSKAEISSQDRGNGAALFSYTPMAAGIYKVNLLSRGEHIKDSPFVAQVVDAEEGFHPSAGRVSGPAKPIYTVGEPVPFKIDNRLVGGKKKPSVTVLDANLNNVPVKMSESGPGTYNCEFTPTQPGKYNVDIALAGVALPGTPLSIPVRHPVDLSKLKIFGPGIEGPVISRVPTQFTIDAKEAGGSRDVKDVQVVMADRQGNSVDIDVLDNNDGSFTVKYTAPNAGAYQVNVVFAGEKISPIEINVKPQIDISGIKVEGLENEKALVGTRVTPRIDIGDLAKKGAKPRLLIDKDGHISEAKLNQLSPSVFATQLPLGKPGNYKFMASVDDVPIAEKTVIVQKGQDALKCRAEGKGLTEATVGKKAVFSIDSNGAGDGNVYVEIQGPSEPETFLKQREDGSCEVEFVPKKPGDYNIGILYGDEKKPIRGSPFLCHVDYPLDASQVKVKGLEKKDVQSGEPVEFEIDVTGTKDAPVTASVPPIYQQPLVEKSQSNPRIYKAKFTPVGEVGEQIPITVNYDGKPLSASPFLVKLQPKPHPDNVQIVQSPTPSGQEQEDKAGTILASREAIVILDLKNCGDVKSCEAVIIGPDGQRRDCIVARGQKTNEIEIRWKTDVAGIYKADVYFDGIKVNKSVEVEALPTASSQDVIRESLESKPHEKDRHKKTEIIHVKPTAEGANTIHVYYGGTEVDNFTYQAERVDEMERAKGNRQIEQEYRKGIGKEKENRDERVAIHLHCHWQWGNAKAHRQSPSTPASSIRDHIDSVVDHQESVYYGQQSSRSSSTSQPSVRLPAAASVSPAKSLTHHSSSTSIESSATDHLYTREFKLNLESGLHSRDLQAEVSMPSSQTKKDTAEIVDNHDGSVSVRYTPKTTGAHELNILHKGAPLQGTPIKFYVDSYADGFATVYGPGLQSAIVGEPAHFTVCARKSNAKELSVSIEGPAKSNIKIHDNKDGTCSVAWVPPVPGEYKAHVSLGGKEVKDSPFTVLVMGEGQKRSHLSVGSTSEVALNINQQELKGISASIKSPSGIEEPCHVRMIDGGRLGVSFTPRESGEHLITVKRDGKLLPKAPFKIKVDKSQVGDASKVEVSGAGKAKAVCCEENELLVDTTKAGYGGLSVSVQGPSKAELRCKEVKAGLIKVLYKPTEPGVYAISVKFADHHVSNSPFTVNCTGKGLGRVQQQFNRKAEQASMVLANQESLVYMKLPGTSPMDTNAKIKDPKGKTEGESI